ncbi:MAG: Spy/CpxP family protein refolding chaperone [Bacteroidota bacterium]
MKNRMMKTAGIFLLAAVMVTGIQAQAQNGKGNGPCGQGRMQQASLDLSEEQQEQMQALRLEHYKVMKPLRNQMAELEAREQTLISEEEVDMKAVNKVIDDQTALQNKMRKLGVEHRLAVREILTDEQLMKLDQRQNFANGRQGRFNQFNGPHPQGRPCPYKGAQKI